MMVFVVADGSENPQLAIGFSGTGERRGGEFAATFYRPTRMLSATSWQRYLPTDKGCSARQAGSLSDKFPFTLDKCWMKSAYVQG